MRQTTVRGLVAAKMAATMAATVALLLAGCPGANKVRGLAGGGAKVDPGSCAIKGSDAGRKLTAFLEATVALDTQLTDLEGTVKTACLAMASELSLPADKLKGDTAAICKNVAEGIRANLKIGLKENAKFNVKYKPAVCTVNVDAAARASLECEGSASANASVKCTGACQGTCTGACSGRCAAQNAQGECAGECEGTCQGSCSGSCEGSAEVSGSAECRADAEVRANIEATCTEPELEITYDVALAIDTSKIEAVKRAAQKGLPTLLMVAAKVNGPVKSAFTTWAQTAKQLYDSASDLAGAFEDQALCVSGQIGAAFEAMAHIEVEINVTVEASAEVGGACGAEAG